MCFIITYVFYEVRATMWSYASTHTTLDECIDPSRRHVLRPLTLPQDTRTSTHTRLQHPPIIHMAESIQRGPFEEFEGLPLPPGDSSGVWCMMDWRADSRLGPT